MCVFTLFMRDVPADRWDGFTLYYGLILMSTPKSVSNPISRTASRTANMDSLGVGHVMPGVPWGRLQSPCDPVKDKRFRKPNDGWTLDCHWDFCRDLCYPVCSTSLHLDYV